MKTNKMPVSVFSPNLAVKRTGSNRPGPAALLLTLLSYAAMLQGCGQKGPLRLPESSPGTAAASAAPASSPAKP
ncbi:lipoprotein [Paucibacter sp. B2R-40]|nr:lipoprotein [Paucibacter sp. B2R-40]